MIDKVIHNNLVKTYLYENLKFEDICNSMNSTEQQFENSVQQISSYNDDVSQPIKEDKVNMS